ncbi:MAG TPA: 7-cyano-7-deazaguanine synthase QueC [Phycisphaerales bacterium]|nr:7-cyano-7-deazaguanine synthase QueC [Phycisphaerales bacterium]
MSPGRDSIPDPFAPRAVVLLSGGLDSAVALACARRDGRACSAISFDYGQRHKHELGAARRVAESLGVPPAHHITVAIDLRAIGGSALTDASIDVPKDRAEPEYRADGPAHRRVQRASAIPVTYVPARNLIFLSCAAGYAETIGAGEIYLGVNAVDYSGYPDCREPFLRAFEHAAMLGTKVGIEAMEESILDGGHAPALRVVSPLVHLSKAQIIRLGSELGVDFSLTHSCYDPVLRGDAVLACGRCDSCSIRRAGFKDAGVPDPTHYA